MSYPRFLLIVLSLSASFRGYRSIDIPVGNWNLTTVENSNKNAGIAETDEFGTDGDMHLGPPGNKKGDHLASAAAYLRAYNATLADEIMSTAGLPADVSRGLDDGGHNTLWGDLFPSLGYFGGSLLTETTGNIYIIWYGSWPTSDKRPILDFISALSANNPTGKIIPTARDWWAINSNNYFDSKKKYVSRQTRVAGQANAGYSQRPKGSSSKPLTRLDLHSIIRSSIAKGLPFNPSGAYFVLSSKDVFVDTFCSTTCSFHSHFTHQKRKLAYSFVGDSTSQCAMYCTYQYMDPSASTFNGIGIDGMISMIAHELAGMFTNPFQGKNSAAGWVVANSQIENADLCTWIFGDNIQWSSQGGKIYAYNLVGPSGKKYIIQQNFNRKTGTCEMRYKK